MNQEKYIDHEVKLRMIENKLDVIIKKLDFQYRILCLFLILKIIVDCYLYAH